MKKSIYILLGFAVTVFSCAKLEEVPESFMDANQYYKTPADAVTAINSVYFLLNAGGNAVQTPYNTLFNTGMNFMGDDENPGPGATNPDVRSQSVLGHASTGLRVLQIWQQHYSGIKKANIAIEKIPGIDFGSNTKLRERLIGEAKFLRALYYFNLVRLYGGVPLILKDLATLEEAHSQPKRNTVEEVYAQIEKDLIEAATVLDNIAGGADAGRATAGAAKALLAKVYLTERKWESAIAKANEVITGPYGYNLIQNYSEVFLPVYKNGREHIFSAQFKALSQGQGNNQAPRSVLTGIPKIVGSYADQVVFYSVPDATKPGGVDKFFSVYKLYSKKDKRRDVTFVTRFQSPEDGKWYGKLNDAKIPGDSIPFFNKYWDPANISNLSESGANVPIIRFSEVLLILAEAENELNGPSGIAYNNINKVRNRAGLPNLTEGLGQHQFRDSLYLERRLEFVFEYQRWFDLIRERDAFGNGILESSLHKVGKTNASAKHYLFPIPQQEIDLNPNLEQNPGW
ncbi:MAG: RagB/SusD family nutrient uptake outer membrane protein [Sporocytophaga sp.]|uniref:RagB/SusD family nutrient uptake outer membrane protein n=1 Tax=Sporocytophaga sp. TaxID=2231183 RepID=UPI001B15EDEC|nr:RagB/SusD family nutrient uptake outer membrane protein [Sporocytophaga sp.]MBO9701305.1 RagB/SusD family nutrient uptake outer membrane protein [Sporocytophaga sp.]